VRRKLDLLDKKLLYKKNGCTSTLTCSYIPLLRRFTTREETCRQICILQKINLHGNPQNQLKTYPQETASLFPLKNINNAELFGVRCALCLLIALDATIKMRLEGADVAGTQKSFCSPKIRILGIIFFPPL